jgi:HK97 family phage major capsid protein
LTEDKKFNAGVREMNLIDLEQAREKTLREQQKLNNKMIHEKRDFTKEEQERYDYLEEHYDDLTDQIFELKRNKSTYVPASHRGGGTYDGMGNLIPDRVETRDLHETTTLQQSDGYLYSPEGTDNRDLYNRYLQRGANALSSGEFRNLQGDIDTSGGFLVTPIEIVKQIIISLDNFVWIRKLANRITLRRAAKIQAPELKTDIGDLTWTTELGTGDEDSDMDLKARALEPHPLARRIRVSNTLLRIAEVSPETLVRQRMTYKIGTVLENAYINGDGSNKPLGFCVASSAGVSTDRDTTTATAGVIKADELIDVVGKLKQQYRPGCVWLMHRDCETRIRKLKDGEGNYLWRSGLEGGVGAPTLCGFPLYLSEYMSNTFTSGNYVAVLANFKLGYWILDSLEGQIKRLDELYQASN